MRSDVTSFTRYFVILIVVFIAWLFMLKDFREERTFRQLFGIEEKTL